MSKLAKLALVAGFAAVVLLVALSAFRRSGTGQGGDLQVAASEPAPAASAEPEHSTFFRKLEPAQPSQSSASVESPQTPPKPATPLADWQARVDQTLGSNQPDADKARQLLELFPQLPPAGQEEVAQHLSNLLPDEDYALLTPSLTNAALPEDVSDLLLDDILNRPNSLKLPALLEVARTADHPKAEEAKDFLELFLDEDYGDNWDTWQAKTQEWLAQNPD